MIDLNCHGQSPHDAQARRSHRNAMHDDERRGMECHADSCAYNPFSESGPALKMGLEMNRLSIQTKKSVFRPDTASPLGLPHFNASIPFGK
ncbi:hypothetical protein G3N96_18945 [Burkholderia sp. Se-20373]|uniref:hypothetical protein n=1 Tax=Burkholderia TaxID=32008 RepID=UPI000F599145|nr:MULTISPECIES: hypothetical protein [Burkholderia]MBN3747485.1 hypothetical protein [Burkholderia sp. Se-20373]